MEEERRGGRGGAGGGGTAITVIRAGIGARTALEETAISAAEEVLGIDATVLVRRAGIGPCSQNLEAEVPPTLSMGCTRAPAVLVALTGIGPEAEGGYAAVGRANEVRTIGAVSVIRALGRSSARFLGAALAKAYRMGRAAIPVRRAEIATGPRRLSAGVHEALEVRIACAIAVRTTLISTGSIHDPATPGCVAGKMRGRGGN